jgi:hypothetical protein
MAFRVGMQMHCTPVRGGRAGALDYSSTLLVLQGSEAMTTGPRQTDVGHFTISSL